MVYEPREDSYFLAGYVKEHAYGNVLDMCAGTGVQAKAALENEDVLSVLAVDSDGDAIARLREELKIYDDARVRESDLFSSIPEEKYDTIVCNPPYLPQEPGQEDRELYGGKEGWEFTVRFLREARSYLARDGQILLLFSSLTNKELLERTMRELGYSYRRLGELAMFFERLYVYKVFHAE